LVIISLQAAPPLKMQAAAYAELAQTVIVKSRYVTVQGRTWMPTTMVTGCVNYARQEKSLPFTM
jgi:hypothetical protein